MATSSSAYAVERLLASADRALRLVCERRDATNGPADLAKLWQIATTMDLVRRLCEGFQGQGLEDVITDVETVSGHLELSRQARERELELELRT
jgi:hypothetical protein